MTWRRVAGVACLFVGMAVIMCVLVNPRVLCHVWGRWQKDVDVRSAQIRERWYALGIRVSERVTSRRFANWVSKLSMGTSPPLRVTGSDGAVGIPRLWESGARSHMAGHAISACEHLALVWELEGADVERRREDIGLFLRLM